MLVKGTDERPTDTFPYTYTCMSPGMAEVRAWKRLKAERPDEDPKAWHVCRVPLEEATA